MIGLFERGPQDAFFAAPVLSIPEVVFLHRQRRRRIFDGSAPPCVRQPSRRSFRAGLLGCARRAHRAADIAIVIQRQVQVGGPAQFGEAPEEIVILRARKVFTVTAGSEAPSPAGT